MRIIKEGSLENWTCEIKCQVTKDQYGFTRDASKKHCGSILEIDEHDLYVKKWFKYPNYEGVDYLIRCPKCGCEIVVPEKLIPEYLKNNPYLACQV